MDIVSNCCNAEIYENSDICYACKEHATPIDLDKEEEDE